MNPTIPRQKAPDLEDLVRHRPAGQRPGFLGMCDLTGQRQLEWEPNVSNAVACRVRSCDGRFVAVAIGGQAQDVFIVDRDEMLGVMQGELYRLNDLRKRWCPYLPPESVTPADIVASAYREGGSKGLAALDGLFATVLWDRQRRETVIYRDGSCARFLYYALLSPAALAFATESDDLFSVLGVPKRLNRRSLHEYLRFLDVSTPNTIYEGVFSADPSVLIQLSGRELRREEQTYPSPAAIQIGLREGAVELDRLLRTSVAERLDSDGVTGFFLSGGVDSSLLLSVGAGLDRARVQAFTIGFEESGYDEMAIATRVAKSLGVRQHPVCFSMDDYRREFGRFLASIDQPFADPAGLPTFLAMEACGLSTRTLIDGTGADTLVGVMPARYSRLATQYASRLPRSARIAMARAVSFVPGLLGYRTILDFDEPQEVLIRWKGWPRSEIERLCGEPVSFQDTRFYQVYARYAGNLHLERYSALMGNLPDDRVHQASRAAGVKVRFPFWDADVVSFIHSLPRGLRYTKKEAKPILKATLARRVPRSLWDAPKHGFDFPFREFMDSGNRVLLKEYLEPTDIAREGLFDPGVAGNCLTRYMRGDIEQGFRVWALLIFRGWYGQHFGCR